jgi:sulfur relay (sulfurtransferase) complex TusBCD TusD component (DsrE family)
MDTCRLSADAQRNEDDQSIPFLAADGGFGAATARRQATRKPTAMTESDWLTCRDPLRMVEFLGNRATERQLRWFALACAERCDRVPSENHCRHALAVARQVLEDDADPALLETAYQHAQENKPLFADVNWLAAWCAAPAIQQTALEVCVLASRLRAATRAEPARNLARAALYSGAARADREAAWDDYEAAVARLTDDELAGAAQILRDVIGNPFRPASLPLACLTWNAGALAALARGIRAEQRFDELPILADALQEAGCYDPAVLEHCRDPGPHVRGCWLLDHLATPPHSPLFLPALPN